MTLGDFLTRIFEIVGLPASTPRQDYLVQQYMDFINASYSEICGTCSPALEGLTRDGVISLIASPYSGVNTTALYTTSPAPNGYNGEYYLDNWAQRVLSVWTEGQAAHPVRMRRRRNIDEGGDRNSDYTPVSVGPFEVSMAPRSRVARLSGASGASTGATAAEGGTTVDFGSGSNVLDSSINGYMLRLDGSGGDYIVTYSGAHQVTTDRPIRSRMTAETTALNLLNVGAGYSNVRWELAPPGRLLLKVLPIPTESGKLYYRYMALPRKLINNSDTPEIQEDMHELILYGALRKISAVKKDTAWYAQWISEWNAMMAALRKSDFDDVASTDPMGLKLPGEDVAPHLVGVYVRDRSGW